MLCTFLFPVVAAALLVLQAAGVSLRSKENPIRPVIEMLEKIRKDIEEQGVRSQELYDKFNCQCHTGREVLLQQIKDAEERIERLQFEYREEFSEHGRLTKSVEDMNQDLQAAQKLLDEANANRQQQQEAYEAKRKEDMLNVNALDLAVKALERGIGSAFLQTGSNAKILAKIAESVDMRDSDRDTLTSFLSASNGQSYEPASAEILGILKQLGDELKEVVKADQEAETVARVNHDALVQAKENEMRSLSDSIRIKNMRAAELWVTLSLVQKEIDDLKAFVAMNKRILEDRIGECTRRKDEHQEAIKMRYAEIETIAKTIKLLDVDPSLELFKKTLEPSTESFLQLKATQTASKKRAISAIRRKGTKHNHRSSADGKASKHKHRLSLISMVLKRKKVGRMDLGVVLGHIEEMKKELAEDQKEDNTKIGMCMRWHKKHDDELQLILKAKEEKAKSIAEHTDEIDKLDSAIQELADSMEAAEKAAKKAKEERDEEKRLYAEVRSRNVQALKLLNQAKVELEKFYKPDLHLESGAAAQLQISKLTPAQVSQMSAAQEDAILSSYGDSFLQAHMSTNSKSSIKQPQKYEKQHKAADQVLGFLDGFIDMLEKEMKKNENDEDEAERNYQEDSKAALELYEADQQSKLDKEKEKQNYEENLGTLNLEMKSLLRKEKFANDELKNVNDKCGWFKANFDKIKDARADQIQALTNAHTVLSSTAVRPD